MAGGLRTAAATATATAATTAATAAVLTATVDVFPTHSTIRTFSHTIQN